MKYIIDTTIIQNHNISLAEFGLLLYYADNKDNEDITYISKSLWNKGYLIKTSSNNYIFNQHTFEELQSILAESSNSDNTNSRARELSLKLQSIYPEGFKVITKDNYQKKYPWRDSSVTITNRLIIFFKRYGNNYTDNQIIDATKRYISGFKDDNTLMKLLKYFIFKDNITYNSNGEVEVEETSELLTFLENPELTESSSINTSELI